MNRKWFIRKGIFFFPLSFTGWIILLAAVIFCVYEFIEIDSRSHSVSDTLDNFIFRAFIVAVVYSAIAYLTSWEKEKK